MSWEYDYAREWTGRESRSNRDNLPRDRNDWDSYDYDQVHKGPRRTVEGLRFEYERGGKRT